MVCDFFPIACIHVQLLFDDFIDSQALYYFRTAGLPQYGQLGHGTDNEVHINIAI